MLLFLPQNLSDKVTWIFLNDLRFRIQGYILVNPEPYFRYLSVHLYACAYLFIPRLVLKKDIRQLINMHRI